MDIADLKPSAYVTIACLSRLQLLGSFMSNGRQILTLQLPKLFQLIMHNDASKPHTRWPNNNVNTAFELLI